MRLTDSPPAGYVSTPRQGVQETGADRLPRVQHRSTPPGKAATSTRALGARNVPGGAPSPTKAVNLRSLIILSEPETRGTIRRTTCIMDH